MADSVNPADLSLDLTDDQIFIVQDYVKNVFRKAQKETLGESKYFWGNEKDIQDTDPSNEGEGEEHFPALEIKVIKDKTEFNVTKHINGVKQSGYDHHPIFPAQAKSHGLKEKARKMSERFTADKIKDLTMPKGQKESKFKTNDDDTLDENYMTKLMEGSFPEESKQNIQEEIKEISQENGDISSSVESDEDSKRTPAAQKEELKEKPSSEKPNKRKMMLNKQATLVKNENFKGSKAISSNKKTIQGAKIISKPKKEVSLKTQEVPNPPTQKLKQHLPPLKLKSAQIKESTGKSQKGSKVPFGLSNSIKKEAPDLPDFDEQAF